MKKSYIDTASARVSVFFFISGKKLNIQKNAISTSYLPRHNICITPYPPDISLLLLFPVIRPEFPDFSSKYSVFFFVCWNTRSTQTNGRAALHVRDQPKKKNEDTRLDDSYYRQTFFTENMGYPLVFFVPNWLSTSID